MQTSDLVRAIAHLCPAPTMAFADDAASMADIDWHDERPKPSDTQVQAAAAALADTFDADMVLIAQEFIERRDTILNVLTGMAGRAQRAGKTDLALAMDALATLLIPLDSNSLVLAAVASRDKVAVRAAFKQAARLSAQQTLNQLPPADQMAVVAEVAKVFR